MREPSFFPVTATARRSLPRRVPLRLEPLSGETLDDICGGKIRLLQRKQGYRFNLDPILLAHFAVESAAAPRGPIIDLGTGCGIIPVILARKLGLSDVTGLEVQPALFELAQRNVHLNRCEQRISLVLADLRKVARKLQPGGFAHVLCNPPYRAAEAGRINPEQEKAIARHELLCTLDDVAAAAAHLLRGRGVLSVVYPASRLSELFEAVRARRLEPKLLRLVHPRAERPAKLALLSCVKGGRAQLEVLPPLVIHRPTGAEFTPEVERMLAGPARHGRKHPGQKDEGGRAPAGSAALALFSLVRQAT